MTQSGQGQHYVVHLFLDNDAIFVILLLTILIWIKQSRCGYVVTKSIASFFFGMTAKDLHFDPNCIIVQKPIVKVFFPGTQKVYVVLTHRDLTRELTKCTSLSKTTPQGPGLPPRP